MTQTSHRYWTTKDAGSPFAEITIVEGELSPDRVRIELTPNTGALQLERTKIMAFCVEYLAMEHAIQVDQLKRERDREIVTQHETGEHAVYEPVHVRTGEAAWYPWRWWKFGRA